MVGPCHSMCSTLKNTHWSKIETRHSNGNVNYRPIPQMLNSRKCVKFVCFELSYLIFESERSLYFNGIQFTPTKFDTFKYYEALMNIVKTKKYEQFKVFSYFYQTKV